MSRSPMSTQVSICCYYVCVNESTLNIESFVQRTLQSVYSEISGSKLRYDTVFILIQISSLLCDFFINCFRKIFYELALMSDPLITNLNKKRK